MMNMWSNKLHTRTTLTNWTKASHTLKQILNSQSKWPKYSETESWLTLTNNSNTFSTFRMLRIQLLPVSPEKTTERNPNGMNAHQQFFLTQPSSVLAQKMYQLPSVKIPYRSTETRLSTSNLIKKFSRTKELLKHLKKKLKTLLLLKVEKWTPQWSKKETSTWIT